MHGLAAWIMRGRLRAIALVVVFAVLPLTGWLSGAVVALVTLRRGAREGLLAAAGGVLGLSALYTLLAGQLLWIVAPAVELWLPVVALAAWLRWTVSLSSTVQLAVGVAALVVLAFHGVVGDPAAYWQPQLERLSTVLPPELQESWRAGVAQMLPVMTGLWALGLLLAALASLLLGRWWQALLYNPGGFGKEFRGLNLGRAFAGITAALWVGAALGGPGVLQELALVASAAFVLQALALVHSLVAAQRLSSAWLIAAYLLLPFGFQLMAVAGMADAAFQWRQKLKLGAGS